MFNYGLRQMFDFMIPELRRTVAPRADAAAQIRSCDSADQIGESKTDASHIDEATICALAPVTGTRGLKPTGDFVVRVRASRKAWATTRGGSARSRNQIEVQIPKGYRPVWALTTVMGVTDEDLTSRSVSARARLLASGCTSERIDAEERRLRFYRQCQPGNAVSEHGGIYADDDKLYIHISRTRPRTTACTPKSPSSASPRRCATWATSTYDMMRGVFECLAWVSAESRH